MTGRVVTLSAISVVCWLQLGQIDENAQPIAFLDDGCPEGGQSAIARRIGVNIAQWHGRIAIVKQPKEPQSVLICLFDSLHMALQEVGAFDRLDDGWLAVLMARAYVSRGKRTLHAVAFQLPVHGRQTFEEAVIGVARLVISRKGHADSGEAGPFISPFRLMSGPGISATVSGTST